MLIFCGGNSYGDVVKDGDNAMNNKLKPCPFCGGKGHIVEMVNSFAPCRMNGYYSEERTAECYMAPKFPAFPTYEEAVEAWNNRVNCPECIKED